jgi:hypothetical protein
MGQTLRAGFRDVDRLRTDEALAPLRGRADFTRVLEEAARRP